MKLKLYILTLATFFVTATLHAQSNHVVVLDKKDETEIIGTFITEVKFKEKGFTSNCSYQEVIKALKEKAVANNANVIKITEHKFPDAMSTCHRVKVALYNVQDVRLYEKEILWSSDRKLEWEDFKSNRSPFGNIEGIAAATMCGIYFETNRLTNFKKPKFFVRTVFDTQKSWVGENGKTPEVLQHEQKHFDLCEIYARRLYKELMAANITVYTIEQANGIYKQVFDEYNERQYNYDVETNHSTIVSEQERWSKMIEDELNALSEYANHY